MTTTHQTALLVNTALKVLLTLLIVPLVLIQILKVFTKKLSASTVLKDTIVRQAKTLLQESVTVVIFVLTNSQWLTLLTSLAPQVTTAQVVPLCQPNVQEELIILNLSLQLQELDQRATVLNVLKENTVSEEEMVENQALFLHVLADSIAQEPLTIENLLMVSPVMFVLKVTTAFLESKLNVLLQLTRTESVRALVKLALRVTTVQPLLSLSRLFALTSTIVKKELLLQPFALTELSSLQEY